MTSLKTANRRVGSLFAVAALVLATFAPGLVPASASAAQLEQRSVQLSNSSAGMENVNYTVQFDTENAGTTGAVVLQFCDDTPLIGVACSAPTGFSVTGATADGFTPSALTVAADNARVYAGTFAATTTIELEGVNNPDAAGALYVRIVTYDTALNAQAYTATNLGANAIDQGSAAVSITDTVGVSGAVLEAMTFCVAGNVIDDINCERVDEAPLTPPTIQLGEAGTDALSASAISEGSIYSQISTNAAGGAVVSLKSGNDCAGLMRSGATVCEIAANTTDQEGTSNKGFDAGSALFGITVSTGANEPAGASGTFQSAAFYSSSLFLLDYASGGASGVTSPFGGEVLNTNSAPANSKNAQITFGASISNDTPAGLYSNDFSLIATGKF